MPCDFDADWKRSGGEASGKEWRPWGLYSVGACTNSRTILEMLQRRTNRRLGRSFLACVLNVDMRANLPIRPQTVRQFAGRSEYLAASTRSARIGIANGFSLALGRASGCFSAAAPQPHPARRRPTASRAALPAQCCSGC